MISVTVVHNQQSFYLGILSHVYDKAEKTSLSQLFTLFAVIFKELAYMVKANIIESGSKVYC